MVRLSYCDDQIVFIDNDKATPDAIIREISEQLQHNRTVQQVKPVATTPETRLEEEDNSITGAAMPETTTISVPNRVIFETPPNCPSGYYRDKRGHCRRPIN